MSSEIRASSALTSAVASSGSADLSIQNPLFSVGEQDAFSRILEQQVNRRDEPRRPSVSEQDTRDQKAASIRREKKADSRQEGGNRLPERQEPVQAREPASRPATQQSEKDRTEDEGATPVASVTAGEPQSTQSATDASAEPVAEVGAETVVSAIVEDVAHVSDELVLAVAEADGAISSEESVLAELAALRAQMAGEESATAAATVADPGALETDSLQAQALSAMDGDQTPVDAELLVQAPAAEAEGAEHPATVDQPAVLAETIAEVVDSSLQPDTNDDAVAAPMPAVSSMNSTRVTHDSSVADAVSAPARHAEAENAAQKAATSVSQGQSQPRQPEAAAPGELANWELGHEPSAGEKNAESRAEFSKQMNAAAERSGPLKDQLVALAQQLKGGSESQSRPESPKSEVAGDIKPTAFGRTLDQLSNARIENGKPFSTGIQTPLGQREWAGELGQRLVMMVSSKLKSAEIHLNPKDLGPVEVRIRMHEDKAHVVFTSQVAQTREALEQAVPRLREMLDQNGVALGNVDVQDHGARYSHQQEQSAESRRSRDGSGVAGEDSVEESVKVTTRAVGLVDYYA